MTNARWVTLIAVAVGVSALPAPDRARLPAFAASEIDWAACPDGEGAECGTLEVPVDYDDHDGDMIHLAVARHQAGDPSARVGVLFTNPGGPGAGGRWMAMFADQLFPAVIVERFDIIGFDPRGTGASAPITCDESTDDLYHLDPTPDDAADEALREQVATEMANACVVGSGELLSHVGTSDTARDMDRLRATLGEDRISYLGYSYGTLLGATYAELFTKRVRAMVLDGAVNPTLPAVEQYTQQARAGELALDAFFEDCAAPGSGCAFTGNDSAEIAARFDVLMAEIDEQGVATSTPGVAVGPGEAHLGVFGALFSPSTWPDLDAALADAERSDGDGLWDLHLAYVGGAADLTYAYWAISALDSMLPTTVGELERIVAESPRLGPAIVAENIIGPWWPVDAERDLGPLEAEGSEPIVVISTLRDPTTAYEAGVALAEQLDHAVLLTYDGDGHTIYGSGESPCVDDLVNAYLVDLVVPPAGTIC